MIETPGANIWQNVWKSNRPTTPPPPPTPKTCKFAHLPLGPRVCGCLPALRCHLLLDTEQPPHRLPPDRGPPPGPGLRARGVRPRGEEEGRQNCMTGGRADNKSASAALIVGWDVFREESYGSLQFCWCHLSTVRQVTYQFHFVSSERW